MLAKTSTEARPKVVVIGLANTLRCDDGVGILIAKRIKELSGSIRVIEGAADPTFLMEVWDGAELAFIVDAAHVGGEPGTVYRLEVGNKPIPARLFRYSTHNYDVSEAIELARALGKLPQEVVVYGIEGASFQTGEGLSPEIEQAAQRVTESILAHAQNR